MIREFKYFRGTKDVHHEINFDAAGKWSTEVVYYPNGQESIVKPWNQRGNLHGVVKEFYRNGELKSEKTYDNGTLMSQDKYDNDYADDEEED
jgi:antitoxin component YwqK of YwqJK toxin-antitoxin module